MIAISAGHYPERPGACFDNFCEHGEAVEWAKLICGHLGKEGFYVPTGFLQSKVDAINNRDIDIAVEIHFNSAVNADGERIGEGCETLYYPESQKGAFIANELQKAITPVLFKDRGIKQGWYRMNPDNGPDFFLARTKCPAIILEPEFIHRKDSIQVNRDVACQFIAETLMSMKGI